MSATHPARRLLGHKAERPQCLAHLSSPVLQDLMLQGTTEITPTQIEITYRGELPPMTLEQLARYLRRIGCQTSGSKTTFQWVYDSQRLWICATVAHNPVLPPILHLMVREDYAEPPVPVRCGLLSSVAPLALMECAA